MRLCHIGSLLVDMLCLLLRTCPSQLKYFQGEGYIHNAKDMWLDLRVPHQDPDTERSQGVCLASDLFASFRFVQPHHISSIPLALCSIPLMSVCGLVPFMPNLNVACR